jgi:cytoskeletal protein RodZ
MLTNTQTVRAPRSAFVLWKWTGVSAVLHALLVGALCAVSYMGFAKREAATRAQAAAEEAKAQKAEADEAAKSANTPRPPVAEQPAASTPAAPATANPPPEPALPSPASTAQPPSAEKILGIDKTAKPSDTPKSPFAGGTDDLLKDLK